MSMQFLERAIRNHRSATFFLSFLLACPALGAGFAGGTGEPNDPYQIATAGQLVSIGSDPNLVSKHYVLVADVDLDPRLPGGKVFDKAVIPGHSGGCSGRGGGCQPSTYFTGTLDGNGHKIVNLTIRTTGSAGLFETIGLQGSVSRLRVVDANIVGGTGSAGVVAGTNQGLIADCYSTGSVSGGDYVGGLVGHNDSGAITTCYSTGLVSGRSCVGGLVGYNYKATITTCYSTGSVSGKSWVGGLVGVNWGTIATCLWDVSSSGLSGSDGGVGLTTAEMKDPNMLALNGFGGDPNWILDVGRDYPRLAWEGTSGQVIAQPQINWLTGSGTALDPYNIDTADQLILLGKASTLWDACYVLTTDIDLDPNLPGRRVFGQAVILSFSGVFDGHGHKISNLSIKGGSRIGMFGVLQDRGEVRGLGLYRVHAVGSGMVGGVVGYNNGTITTCYSTGSVSGTGDCVGGLVGLNDGTITTCYSTGSVSGISWVGGLVGYNNSGAITTCYSTGPVSSKGGYVGGLVSWSYGAISNCFWDMTTSGQTSSFGGKGKTTAQMQDINTFLGAGWDFIGERANGLCEYWQMTSQGGYPVLSVLNGYIPPEPNGTGSVNDPYIIWTPEELGTIWYRPSACYKLGGDIDLSGIKSSMAVIPIFDGAFDGQGHEIHGLTIAGQDCVGLFGWIKSGAEISNLGLEGVSIFGHGCVGGLVGRNSGTISSCYSTGLVSGRSCVGGLVGYNYKGTITTCYSTGSVTGWGYVGGLVGRNNSGTITTCYSTGSVSGTDDCAHTGGLVGENNGTITTCYSTGSVSGRHYVGGLVGANHGTITICYSTGSVSGSRYVGGLVGQDYSSGTISKCFWDMTTSGRTTSVGGIGLTTAQMQTVATFLGAGWDFVNTWMICEGKDYPRLQWEQILCTGK